MQHRKIARALQAAGGMAALGVIFVFYISPIARTLLAAEAPAYAPALFMALAGIPYLAALIDYFRICANIGREQSFCQRNVHLLLRISRLLLLDAALWLAALVVLLFAGIPAQLQAFSFFCHAIAALFILANLAVSLVAYMMARLLNHAEALQAENDLTI